MELSRPLSGLSAPRHAGLAVAATAAAATALWVRHRAHRAERRHPPAGRFIKIDGARLHYLELGDGPPVVLLHGKAMLLQDFVASGLIERLASRHRVIAFDRPGYGYSTRPRDRLWTPGAQAALLARAFARMGVERPVVVGHSLGALVALALAVGHPSATRGLVLLAGYYYPTARLDVLLDAPAALPVLGDAMRHTVWPLLDDLLLPAMTRAMFSPASVPSRFLQVVPRSMVTRPAQIRASAEDSAFMVPAAAGLRRHYRDLHLPVHILAGAGDRIIDPQAHAVRLNRELPDSTLTVLPRAGHMVHYAATRRVVALVDEIIGQTAGSD